MIGELIERARGRGGPILAACLGLLLPAVPAWGEFEEAAKKTRPAFSVRYRLETVDQDGIEEDALASTAKARASWVMDAVEGFSVGVEVDHVFTVGSDDYHSLENGRTEFPIVADPTGTDLNQALFRFRRGGTILTGGRQRILHGEQRFVGGVAWRQNEQAYDGVRIQSSGESTSIDYSYIANVRRIFGPDDGIQPAEWEGNMHFLRATYTPSEDHVLAAFTCLLDLENDNGPVNSNASYGLNYVGTFGPATLSARVALQREWGDNPLTYDAPYYFVEAKWPIERVTIVAGHEVLGTDDGAAPFRTPLGTLHKFQGWTDKFLSTPDAGVKDSYLTFSGTVGSVALTAAIHEFVAAKGDMNFGREAGVSAVWSMGPLDMQFKYARYHARDLAADTDKAWFMVSYAF